MFKFKTSSLFRKQSSKLSKPSIEHILVYDSETDIYPYHNYAVWKLKQDVQDVDVKKRLKEIEKMMTGAQCLSLSEYYDLDNEKNQLENKLELAPIKLTEYLSEVQGILKEYKETHNRLQVKFGAPKESKICEVKEIISRFQKILNKYIPDITLTPEDIPTDCCQQCGEKVTLLEDEDIIDCPNCGISVLENLALSSEYLGLNAVKAYESVHNFARALEEFQGNVKLPPNSVIQKVKDYVQEHKLQHNQLYALDIRDILKTLGYNKWYKASHLILHKVVGGELHDITEIKENLLQDFQTLDRLYKQHKISERQSSINVWKIMEVLLRKNGYECHTKNFKKPITGDINIENNRILIKLFDLAGWNSQLII